MTDERLAEIKSRCYVVWGVPLAMDTDDLGGITVHTTGMIGRKIASFEAGCEVYADLLVRASADQLALVTEVKRLRHSNQALRKALGRLEQEARDRAVPQDAPPMQRDELLFR